MAEVIKIFQNLAQFYSPGVCREQIEEIFANTEEIDNTDNSKSRSADEDNETDSDGSDTDFYEANEEDELDVDAGEGTSAEPDAPTKITSPETIPMVKCAVNYPEVLSALLELCTSIRNLRESNGSYDNTFDCWDRVIEVSPREQYLTFVYSLISLAGYDPTSKIYRKLSIATARAYILSLTIPGSKGFHIFDDKMIGHAIEVFRLIDRIQHESIGHEISKPDRVEIWVNFSNLCDDIKIMFRYVHFDEYKDVRNSILWELNKLLYNNHVNGYENIYAANLHSKCFEIYDEVTNAHNGDPEDTCMKIMRISYCLHVFSQSPKHRDNFVVAGTSDQFCEHISDWFVTVINKYPRIVTKVLKHFIECIVTNPEKEWRGEQLQRVFDYAAKYDAALYTKCNESILPFLLEASNADDGQIRLNATEMLNRLTLMEAKVNWEVFRHEISNIPREIHVIKELVNRLIDTNNSVKLRAVNGLLNAFLKGTQDAKKIMTEGIRFATFNDENVHLPPEPRARYGEIRYKKPEPLQPSYTFEGHELIAPSFSKLPQILYYLLNSSLAHVRRAVINMIEHIVFLSPCVIYYTKFVQETTKLGEDPSPLVRKQALLMIDSVLGQYLNCYPVVYAWCRIIVPLFQDSDSKITDQAWECFKKRVFDNIRGIDNTNKAEHFMPWVILRVLLSTKQRHYLQSCIHSAINNNIIDEKVLALIESHTLTSNSTEAWVMLSFIVSKMKSREPDALISSFIKSMLEQSWNAGQNLQLILEVLNICINDFSHTALNMAFSCTVNLMKSGNIPPNCVSKAFNFCMTINGKSERNKKKNDKRNLPATSSRQIDSAKTKRDRLQMKWVEEVYETAEKYLLEHIKHFDTTNRSVIMSYLFCYTETNLELMHRPNPNIVHFVHNYLDAYVDTPDSEFEPEDINTLNQMIILAARFSIRDPINSNITCLLYRLMLRKTERSTTVNNIIVCMTDLCKRHTQTVEMALGEMLSKLRSPYLELRLVTFKNVVRLVLEDLVKLRGNLLLFLLATLLDKSRELSNRATEFFLTYCEQKDSTLFQTCLLECPFVFNGYLNFDGFESFNPCEMKVESPLKGRENLKARRMLYKIFMLEQEETVLLVFFENLKILHTQILNDITVQCDEGCFMIRDFLYILKEICHISLEKMDPKSSTSTNSNIGDVDLEEDIVADKTVTGKNANEAPKEKRKNKIPTMNEAIAVVEKMIPFLSKIADIILKWDSIFEKPIDDLCIAICLRFENLTEFLKPLKFWSKYRHLAKERGISIKKKRAEEAKNSEKLTYDDDEIVFEDTRNSATTENVEEASTIPLLFKPFLDIDCTLVK